MKWQIKLKDMWVESPIKTKVCFVAIFCGVGAALYFTAQFWVPPVICVALISMWITTLIQNKKQEIATNRELTIEKSRSRVLSFIQWFFSKSQRERLGLHAVPLSGSLAYLKEHCISEEYRNGVLHIVTIGLYEFNTESFYLLWESLTQPINDALQEYCKNYFPNYTNNSAVLQVVSVDIIDGAIQPLVVIKIYDSIF